MDKKLVEYFIAETNKKFEKIDKKLDDLFVFKWKIIGGASLASLIITAGVDIIIRLWGH